MTTTRSRRRAWTWRWFFRWAFRIALVITIIYLVQLHQNPVGISWLGVVPAMWAGLIDAAKNPVIWVYFAQIIFLFFANFLILFGPMLFPIARTLGIHEVQYAIVAVLAMGVGLYTPPFGIGYYQACAISRIDPAAGMSRVWPYLAVLALGVIVIAAVPAISTVTLH